MVAKGLAGKQIGSGGARQPWWRDIRLGPGKSRLLIWLHTALRSCRQCAKNIRDRHHSAVNPPTVDQTPEDRVRLDTAYLATEYQAE